MAKTISMRFKNTPEDQARAREIVELLRDNIQEKPAGRFEFSWLCDRCGREIETTADDPTLPPGWTISHSRLLGAVECDECNEEASDGE